MQLFCATCAQLIYPADQPQSVRVVTPNGRTRHLHTRCWLQAAWRDPADGGGGAQIANGDGLPRLSENCLP